MSVIDSLQDALASEHALVHAYGVLGARTSQSANPELHARLVETYREHRSRRDSLDAFVVEAGATPVAAEATYDTPATWTTPAAVLDAAITLENSSAESMAALVASTSGTRRRWALDAMVWSSRQAVLLGDEAATWPGAPELGVDVG